MPRRRNSRNPSNQERLTMAQFDIDQTTETLERDGIVVLPNFLQGAALASIQDSFTCSHLLN